MAIGGTIYGSIEAPWGVVAPALRRHNVRGIDHLPRADEWPPLIGKMFGITGLTAREGAYDQDLIHFGATLRGLDEAEAVAWVAKFEALLRRLFWFRAVMLINWIFGDRKFVRHADDRAVKAFLEGRNLRGVDRWTFETGGSPLSP